MSHPPDLDMTGFHLDKDSNITSLDSVLGFSIDKTVSDTLNPYIENTENSCTDVNHNNVADDIILPDPVVHQFVGLAGGLAVSTEEISGYMAQQLKAFAAPKCLSRLVVQ